MYRSHIYWFVRRSHLDKTEPLEVKVRMDRDSMSNPSCRYRYKFASISKGFGGIARTVCLLASRRDAMDYRPLLDLFEEILVGDEVVGGAVEGLEFGV
jgi:hypothetical protein